MYPAGVRVRTGTGLLDRTGCGPSAFFFCCAPTSVRSARLEWRQETPGSSSSSSSGGGSRRTRRKKEEDSRTRTTLPRFQLTGHLLSSLPLRFGTMFADSWSRSMWRATWILFFSLLIHSARAQGKKGHRSAPAGPIRARVCPAGFVLEAGGSVMGSLFSGFLRVAYNFLIRLHITVTHTLVLIAG